MQRLIEIHGNNDLVDCLLWDEMTLDEVTNEAIQAWLSAVEQTATNTTLLKIGGTISVAEFQQTFKAVKERISPPSPSSLHYSIWKVVVHKDNLEKWLSIMMSLTFMYGFDNKRWVTTIDVMIEKEKDIRKIHQLIIGVLEADFNTALKILSVKKLMAQTEQNGLHNDQWGSKLNRASTDPALRKMMTFEYSRYVKATIAVFLLD